MAMKRWSPAKAAGWGACFGVFSGFLKDLNVLLESGFSNVSVLPADEAGLYIIGTALGGAIGFGVLGALVAVIRNLIMRAK
jgi:hypothetical protein